ncbi:MAG TPA: HAMP domain-containing sensor histidine kinase [Pyrinomonadaceae bacterium]|nr:HAMP domain-containing sensor histidine kinase [Pyrinomonadaceae bacterium]
MRVARRRKSSIFFLVLGICLVGFAVALYVGWILLNLQQIALLVLGVIFFSLIITGLILNTSYLIREIRRNEQQDAFLNAVTHELKTPIASLRLYLETLKTRDIKPAKQQEFYDVMLADTERLLNTVEQVLLASRAREQKRILSVSQINLTQLLRECVERIRHRYDLSEDIISLPAAAEDKIKISGDLDELQAVFMNLLDNAVKYSPRENGVKIALNVKNLNEKFVIVRIKDSGIGIPPSELKRIFRRFYRVPNRATQRAKGTGLGLFIVRSIVSKHGGKIWAESAGLGKGSAFMVQLPKTVSDNGSGGEESIEAGD